MAENSLGRLLALKLKEIRDAEIAEKERRELHAEAMKALREQQSDLEQQLLHGEQTELPGTED